MLGLVLNDVQHDVREDTQRHRDPQIGAPRRLSHDPRQRREQRSRSYRVRIRKEVQMHGTGRNAKVLDAEVGKNDPEQLNELNRYQQRPQPDSWIFLLENQRC
jgi:hypothetical protein